MLLYGLAAIVVLFTILWAVSVRLENSSIVDVAWGPGILAVGLTYYLTGPAFYFASADGFVLRPHLVLALAALWAFRLASHLYARMRIYGEDFRYVGWRDRYEGHWWWISLFKVFLLQAVLAWVVSLPLYFAIVSMSPRRTTVARAVARSSSRYLERLDAGHLTGSDPDRLPVVGQDD